MNIIKQFLLSVILSTSMICSFANSYNITLHAESASGDWINYGASPTGLTASCNVTTPSPWNDSLTGISGQLAIADGQTKVFDNITMPPGCNQPILTLFVNTKQQTECWVSFAVDLTTQRVIDNTHGCQLDVATASFNGNNILVTLLHNVKFN